jgi:hypothetical protein
VPPSLGSQRINAVKFAIKDLPIKWVRAKEKSALAREIDTAIVGLKGGAPGKIAVTATYQATMFERQMVKGNAPAPVANLTPAELKLFTAATPTCNYTDAKVQGWIAKYDLTKHKDETEPGFAFRVFRMLQGSLRYEVPNAEVDFFRCTRTIAKGSADCGASNVLFCGVLRNSGIPARVYCGRWIINPKPGDSHSRGEFFIKGVGWVPVDATALEKPSDSANRKNFGTDPGLYFATSMETDWRIELPQYGVQELAWLHQYIVPYRYKDRPTWDGFKLQESFSLTER